MTASRPPSQRGPDPRERGPLPWPGDDDRLTPFLPMLYVAWSDGMLSRSEMERLREELMAARELPEDGRRVLESWLSPDLPPSPVELAQLKDRIRQLAGRVSEEERRSLRSLGVAMARAGAREAGGWGTEEGMRVLQGVEEILGVLGGEAARELVAPLEGVAEEVEPRAQPFEADALRRVLLGDRASLRKRILGLLEDPELRVPDGLPTPEARKRVFDALRRLAKEDLGALAFPEEFGGEEDVVGSLVAFETLAFGNLSVLIKYGVQFGLFGGSVLGLGTERHHRRYLREIATLELPGIYAMTERDHGSNVRDLETRARYLPESDEFEVHTPHPGARKDWLGNAALHGRMATVFAQLEVSGEAHGVHALLVPIREKDGRTIDGVGIEDCGEKVGLHGVDNGRLSFDRVRVPRENLLDRFGSVGPDGEYRSRIASPGRRFFTMLRTLVAGRISIAAASVSTAKSGLAIAVRYSHKRRQFGPSGLPEVPVLDYLTQQRSLLIPLATTYALHFAVRDLVREYGHTREDDDGSQVEDDDGSQVDVLAAGLKAYASRHAQETLQACREAMGGRGYLAENRLGFLREDTDIFTTFEGANVVLLQLVAKGLLSEYRDEMGDLRLWGMVRALGERAGDEVTRRNPVRSRRTAEEHLRDPEVQLDAFRFRERRLLQTAARRLKGRIDEGMDSFQAMNECQDHLVALARAHVERVVLEGFRKGVAQAREGEGEEVGACLESLSHLFALSRMEKDRAWFLEAGYMEGSQAKAIRKSVNRLCRELRTSAVALVDAFGISDAVLGAPDAVSGRAD